MKNKHSIAKLVLAGFALLLNGCNDPQITPYDVKRAKEFVLSSLRELPEDVSNKYGDDQKAALLGKKLFFDTGLSANNAVSCAVCHDEGQQFQDGLKLGQAIGQSERRTMPLRGVQWGSWYYWDGRKDSQWSQALEPLETPSEHGMTRDMVARHVLNHYGDEYQSIFKHRPDMTGWPYFASPLLPGLPKQNWLASKKEDQQAINLVFANTGKALAAFQRQLLPEENRVDRYLTALLEGKRLEENEILNVDEIKGFQLFTGKARCDNCHSGPLYTDHFFHNTGVPIARADKPDYGRAIAVLFLKDDIFSCLGEFSDAQAEQCRELLFMSEDPVVFEGSFKTPGLRGVGRRAPYMHAGQFETLEEVVDHYLARPDPFATLPEPDGSVVEHGEHSDVPKIELTKEEQRQLIAFLKAL